MTNIYECIQVGHFGFVSMIMIIARLNTGHVTERYIYQQVKYVSSSRLSDVFLCSIDTFNQNKVGQREGSISLDV